MSLLAKCVDIRTYSIMAAHYWLACIALHQVMVVVSRRRRRGIFRSWRRRRRFLVCACYNGARNAGRRWRNISAGKQRGMKRRLLPVAYGGIVRHICWAISHNSPGGHKSWGTKRDNGKWYRASSSSSCKKWRLVIEAELEMPLISVAFWAACTVNAYSGRMVAR